MDETSKNRLRLWLSAEQALGIGAIPISPDDLPQLDERRLPPQRQVAPPPRPAPSRTAPSRTAPAARTPAAPPHPTPTAPSSGTKYAVDPSPARSKPAPRATSARSVPLESPLISTPLTAPLGGPILSTEEKRAALERMDRNEVSICTLCRLHKTRTHTVFGEGDVDAQLMFIGEGPGENEDLAGRPFVGRAGDFLNKMILAMGLQREQVFITNIVKCRPPDNRTPAPDEVAACAPYLERQIQIIRPRVIVTLGLPASQTMLSTKISMAKMRGQWHSWRGIKLMPTYHPAYVLRKYTAETRGAVWSDLQQVMVELGLPPRAGAGSA